MPPTEEKAELVADESKVVHDTVQRSDSQKAEETPPTQFQAIEAQKAGGNSVLSTASAEPVSLHASRHITWDLWQKEKILAIVQMPWKGSSKSWILLQWLLSRRKILEIVPIKRDFNDQLMNNDLKEILIIILFYGKLFKIFFQQEERSEKERMNIMKPKSDRQQQQLRRCTVLWILLVIYENIKCPEIFHSAVLNFIPLYCNIR